MLSGQKRCIGGVRNVPQVTLGVDVFGEVLGRGAELTGETDPDGCFASSQRTAGRIR